MSQLNSPLPLSPKNSRESQSQKFQKLLSNKLQAKSFYKADMFNNFKSLSRNSILEQTQHFYSKSNQNISINDEILSSHQTNTNYTLNPLNVTHTPPTSSNWFDSKFFYTEQSQKSLSQPHIYYSTNQSQDRYNQYELPLTPQSNYDYVSQLNQTPIYQRIRQTKYTGTKNSTAFQTPNYSPNKGIEFNIQSAKISSKSDNQDTQGQYQKPSIHHKHSNSYFQTPYLSRSKDQKRLELIEKSKQSQNDLIDQMDIPSYSEYLLFMQRQKALNSLLQDLAIPKTQKQQYFSEQIHNNQSLKHIYQSKNINQLNNKSKQNTETVQQSSQKNQQIKSVEKLIPCDQVDQGMFNSYLQSLKNSYSLSMSNNALNNNNSINNNNNQINKNIFIKTKYNNNSLTSLPNQMMNIDSTFQSTQTKDEPQVKKSNHQNKNQMIKSQVFFNPKIFSQGNLASYKTKRKSINITKSKDQKNQNAQSALNIGDSYNTTGFLLDAFQSEEKQREQTERQQFKIKTSTFSAINSPKASIQEDTRILLQSPKNQQKLIDNKLNIEQQNSDMIVVEELNFSPKSIQVRDSQKLAQVKQNVELRNKIDDIDVSITKIIDYIKELKILYNSNIQFSNIIQNIPGYNDLLRSFIQRDGSSSIHVQTQVNSKASILNYLIDKQVLKDKMKIQEKNNHNEGQKIDNQNLAVIDQYFQEIPIEVLEEIQKEILYFSRNIFSHVQLKREEHQKRQVDDVKIQIMQISEKTQQQFRNLSNQVPTKYQNIVQLQHMQDNIQHIIDRKKYIKQQPFIEKFENKEEQLGQFKKVSEVSRNKSKHLNELNDILRNFHKFT